MYYIFYLIDMITFGFMIIFDLKVNVFDQFIVSEQRYYQFVFGFFKGYVIVFGKIVSIYVYIFSKEFINNKYLI